ncbi:MAG TPA: DUF6644 family protein [Bryobacteraceae bacterium]|jgi:hypothetical protein|nr:DUF6644 family protein [Bryobacteraceae bacterium]
MSIADISHAIQSLGLMTYIRESGYTYPMIMSTHLACIAVFGGLILLTDLRLLGWALTDMPISNVVNGLRNWKRLGFLIMFTMGFLLATSEMDKYYANPYFILKMCLLVAVAVHAFIFKSKVYDHPERLDTQPAIPRVAKVAATWSLIVWIGIACLGRWIAYYEPPKNNRTAPVVATASVQP